MAASGESERPARVEVGQRWGIDTLSCIVREAPWPTDTRYAEILWNTGTGGIWKMADILKDWRYLGGPQPPAVPREGPGVRAMGVGPNGCPVACLRCGGQWDRRNSDYVCRDCCEKHRSAGGTCACAPLLHAWRAGARNFPRPAPSVTPATTAGLMKTGHTCAVGGCPEDAASARDLDGYILCDEHRGYGRWPTPAAPTRSCHRCGASHAEKLGLCAPCDAALEAEVAALEAEVAQKPVYGRMVGEMLSPEGVPLSALQAIQARKAPEPWVPEIDEWDLLPDAGR